MTEHNKELTAAQMLFEARTSGRRKREITTISKLLCIREEYLIALEKGNYRQIPELVYILGFARNYAMELGLDPDEIIAKIKKEMGLVEEVEIDIEEPEEEKTLMAPAIEKKIKPSKASDIVLYFSKHWKFLIVVIIALVIIISGMFFLGSLADESAQSGSAETAAVVLKEPEYKVAVREKFGTENRASAKVIIQATQESWVKIEDARGNTVFSRVLVPGDVYYVPDGDKYKGTFGNAGGVDVWLDGTLAPKLGASHTRKSGVLMTVEGLAPAPAPAPVPAE